MKLPDRMMERHLNLLDFLKVVLMYSATVDITADENVIDIASCHSVIYIYSMSSHVKNCG